MKAKAVGLAAAMFAGALIMGASVRGAPSGLAVQEPGGTPDDRLLAIDNPDEYAWRLFKFLNRPALPGVAGIADPSRQFGDTANQVSMVWETWAMASGRNASEVYHLDGSAPVAWDHLDRSARKLILDTNLERLLVLKSNKAPGAQFMPDAPEDQEVRMNQAAFEFIVTNQMYNIDGLEALQATAAKNGNRLLIQFKTGAKEVKAMWKIIKDDQKPRYLWREGTAPDGSKQIYGLVSLHIVTKDLPNWFWADFGHVDCEEQKNACDIPGQEAALTVPKDTTTRGPNGAGPNGHNGIRNEAANSVWANYILRGTQTNFVAPDGRETVLSNPVIENGFQNSSCITCHARAAVGPRLISTAGPVRGINRLSPGEPQLGSPERALFGDSPAYNQDTEIKYLQTDFLWSPIFRTSRKTVH